MTISSQEALEKYFAALGYNPAQQTRYADEVQQQQALSQQDAARQKLTNQVLKKATKEGAKQVFGTGSQLAQNQAANVAYNQAAGLASQTAWNAGATAAQAAALQQAQAAQAAYNLGATGASNAVGGAAQSGMAAANAANAANTGTTVAANTAANTGSFANTTGIGTTSAGGYLAAAMDTYNNYKKYQNARDEDKALAAQKGVAMAVGDIFTAGLAGMVGNYAEGQWGGTMKKIYKLDAKTNPVTIFANRFATNAWMKERNRLHELQKQGLKIDTTYIDQLRRGRDKKQLFNKALAADYVGADPAAGWVNNKFAKSRKESDLVAGDITGYAFLPEKFGQKYLDADAARKNVVADWLLKAGAVREHKGTMDYGESFNSDLENKIKAYLEAPATPAKPANIPRTGRGPGGTKK
jgi:hypothetical protein